MIGFKIAAMTVLIPGCKLIYNHKIYVDMSIYGHSPSPLKPYSKSNVGFNTNQSSTGFKSQIEKVYTIESPDRQHLGATLDAEQWRRKNLQTDIKYSKIEDKARKIYELQQKTEVILRHNTHLLAENSSLKDALAAQQAEIQSLRHELSAVLMEQRQPSFDRLLVTEQLERKNYEHRIEVQKLLAEISKLHQQCFQIQTIKNSQLQRLRSQFQQASYQQIQTLKRSQHGNNELYQLQIRKLKQTLDQRNCQLQESAMVNKRQKEVLLEELANLKADYKLLQQRRENELEEAKAQAECDVSRVGKEARMNEEAMKGAFELAMKRMRKDLGDRMIDIERLNNRIDNSSQENQFLGKQLREERDRLNAELAKIADDSDAKIMEERLRLEKLAEVQISNYIKAGENKAEMLEAEIRKLTELLEMKSKSIQDMNKTADLYREQSNEQFAALQRHNKALREKLYEINQAGLQQIELAKIKMSQLHQADLKSIVSTYQPKIQSLSQQLHKKSTQLDQLRNQLHKQLQAKLHLRKQYQLQLSKLRSIIMDLRIQLSAVHVEMKQNITSLRSKMDFASQSLLNDNQLKLKNMKFCEQEMRKLRQAIEAKDAEMLQIQENWAKKEEFYGNQVARLGEKLNNAKKELDEKEAKRGKEVGELKEEVEKLRGEVGEERDRAKEAVEGLKGKVSAAQEEVKAKDDHIRVLEKQIQAFQEKCKKLEHEIGLAHGHLETVRMESEVNLNDQKERHKSAHKETESTLREYFERRIKELETDKNELNRINSAQADQIRELVAKYNELEKNLKDLLESQKRLTDFENRVINLGMDQNLIKNMAELLRR